MAHGKSVEPEVAFYLQHRLRDLLATPGIAANVIAEQAGVTKGQISQLKNHAVGVGWRTLKGMSDVLGMSVDEIEAAAKKWAKQNAGVLQANAPDTRIDLRTRLPNRQLAAIVARRSGVEEEAIEAVLMWALKSNGDPSPLEWLEDMLGMARRLRREAGETEGPVPGVARRRRRG
jgi:transcriptional regulator with XRE-family HTH domain